MFVCVVLQVTVSAWLCSFLLLKAELFYDITVHPCCEQSDREIRKSLFVVQRDPS